MAYVKSRRQNTRSANFFDNHALQQNATRLTDLSLTFQLTWWHFQFVIVCYLPVRDVIAQFS